MNVRVVIGSLAVLVCEVVQCSVEIERIIMEHACGHRERSRNEQRLSNFSSNSLLFAQP